jgi:hypothetical protein
VISITNVGQQNISFIVADAQAVPAKLILKSSLKKFQMFRFHTTLFVQVGINYQLQCKYSNETSIESYSWTIDGVPVEL